jgi:hypothetical protein
VLSINSQHLLVLTSEQPFRNQIEAINQWLPETVRELDQILAGRAPVSYQAVLAAETQVGEAEIQVREEETFFRSLEEELRGVEVPAEDQAAIDAMFSQAGLQEVQKTNLDDFWENLAEQNGTLHTSEGSLSFDEALDLGLAQDDE